MKYILILISFIALSAKAQTWTVITNLEYKDGRINAYNSLGKQIHQVNCKDMVYVDRQNGEINIYDYKNENNNLILTNKLVSPTLASVRDSLNAWIASCNSTEKIDSLINVSNGILTATKKLDSTHIDTSLIQHIQLQQIIDSLSVLINDSTYSLILNKIYSQILRLDTSQIDTSLDKSIIDNDFDSVLVLNDSIKVYFTQPIEAKDTTHQTILNEINSVLNNINQRIDTTQQDTSFINYFTEWNRNNDTLSSILQELKTLDSVYVVNRDTAVVSVVGMKDTLFTYDLDTSVVLTIDSTYYFQLDSIIKLLQKDTMQFEYHSFCYRSKADSGVYEFSQIFNVTNPLVPIFMSFVDIDSLTLLYSLVNGVSVGTIPNFATDYVPCERWNEYLSSTKQDTLKTLVFKAQTKRIDGTLDTLYNCKGLSFSVSDNATGNITFYYGNGDQDVFDVANEQLPFWENGSFVEFIGFDASSVAGVLRVNMLGCSQTPDVICAKEKPIVNCTTSTPIIICSGWGSLSGIWSTISGCWNTGQ